MIQTIGNLANSVFKRLKIVAHERKRPVQEILKYYAMERFLYRLSVSPHKDSFFLKGGLMLRVWDPLSHRATVDIDLLGRTSNATPHLRKVVTDICGHEGVPDGIEFATDSLDLRETQLRAEYRGVHAAFSAKLHTAKLPMRIDIGFSDLILPCPALVRYPSLLDLPAPELRGYTPQTMIAEKFESIVRLDFQNTRLKDFYDIWQVSQQFQLDRQELHAIVRQVCTHRGTSLSQIPVALTESFSRHPSKTAQWSAFLKDIAHDPIPLNDVVRHLRTLFEGLFPD